MSRRDEFQKLMQDNLTLWGGRLSALAARHAVVAPADERAAQETMLGRLEAQSQDAVQKLDALKATHGGQWDVLKLELARAWHDLDAVMTAMEKKLPAQDDTRVPANGNE